MISTKNIVDKANSKIAAGNLTSLEISQLSGVNTFLSGSAVPSVATFTDLPDVQLNKGRLLYVIDEEIHYFSDGDIWTSDFSSQSTNILYAWGLGTSGQLGDNTTINKASPVTVVGGITNWSKISAGSSANHSLALIDTGVLYTWGGNNVGELGDGTTIARSSPITVVGGITNWSQISAGTNFSLALTDNGVLYAWGSNLYGSIGDGTTTYRSSPVTVVGGITSWSQITSALTTLALTDTGILYAW
jgi:alpha-tubulin suppressor-like RCC1 family protein